MGATLHELGHLTHYWNNTYTNPNTTVSYSSTHLLLQESFASYVGWYLGEEYYKTVGKQMSNSALIDITGNNRQQWRTSWKRGDPATPGEYSPLFVDLTDNLEQEQQMIPYLLPDNIVGVPASTIWEIITTSQNWAQCRQKLSQRLVPTYCTSAQLETYLANFDEWFSYPDNR